MKRCEHKGCNHNMEAEGNSNGDGNGNGKRLSWQSIVCNLRFTSIEGRRTSVHEGPVRDHLPMAISEEKWRMCNGRVTCIIYKRFQIELL